MQEQCNNWYKYLINQKYDLINARKTTRRLSNSYLVAHATEMDTDTLVVAGGLESQTQE